MQPHAIAEAVPLESAFEKQGAFWMRFAFAEAVALLSHAFGTLFAFSAFNGIDDACGSTPCGVSAWFKVQGVVQLVGMVLCFLLLVASLGVRRRLVVGARRARSPHEPRAGAGGPSGGEAALERTCAARCLLVLMALAVIHCMVAVMLDAAGVLMAVHSGGAALACPCATVRTHFWAVCGLALLGAISGGAGRAAVLSDRQARVASESTGAQAAAAAAAAPATAWAARASAGAGTGAGAAQ